MEIELNSNDHKISNNKLRYYFNDITKFEHTKIQGYTLRVWRAIILLMRAIILQMRAIILQMRAIILLMRAKRFGPSCVNGMYVS